MTKKDTSSKDPKKDSNPIIDDSQRKELQSIIDGLNKKLAEQEEITKRAQSDYFRLKMDFDAYTKRQDELKQSQKIDALTSSISKITPCINQLEQSIQNIPSDMSENSRGQGIKLIYTKLLSDLSVLGVTPIEVVIGSDPDFSLHVPIGMEDVEDESLKNKIIKQIEGGFLYQKDGVEKVIAPAKVIVGS